MEEWILPMVRKQAPEYEDQLDEYVLINSRQFLSVFVDQNYQGSLTILGR